MRLISLITLLSIIVFSLLNIGCSNDPVAGGVSEEANAFLINGNAKDTNGVVIDSAKVIILPTDFIPGESLEKIDSMTVSTDSNGYFEFEVDDTSRQYNVYASYKNISTIIWKQLSSDTNSLNLILRENGALRIVLPDTLDTANGEVLIEGFPFALPLASSKVSSKAGYAVLFANLPPGFIDEISYRDKNIGLTLLDTSVEVLVGDTQTVLGQNEFVQEGIDYTHLNIGNSNLPTNSVYGSLIGNSGVVWFATEKGVVKYEVYQDTTWTIYSSSNTPMEADIINCVYYNKNTNIAWIGLYGGGLAKFDGTAWTTWREEESSVPHDNVTGIVYESGRGYWLATDGGVALFDETNWTVFNSSETALLSDNIADIDIKDGNKWIVSTGGSIAKIDSTDNITVYDSSDEPILSNGLYCIKADPNTDDVWVGTQQGLLKFDGNSWISYDAGDWGNTESRIATIALDNDGTLWVGTFSGLLSYDGSNWTDHSGYPGGQLASKIEDIYIDNAGNKWCSLFNNGVVVFDTLQ